MAIRTPNHDLWEKDKKLATEHRVNLAELLIVPNHSQTCRELADLLRRQAELIEGELNDLERSDRRALEDARREEEYQDLEDV